MILWMVGSWFLAFASVNFDSEWQQHRPHFVRRGAKVLLPNTAVEVQSGGETYSDLFERLSFRNETAELSCWSVSESYQ